MITLDQLKLDSDKFIKSVKLPKGLTKTHFKSQLLTSLQQSTSVEELLSHISDPKIQQLIQENIMNTPKTPILVLDQSAVVKNTSPEGLTWAKIFAQTDNAQKIQQWTSAAKSLVNNNLGLSVSEGSLWRSVALLMGYMHEVKTLRVRVKELEQQLDSGVIQRDVVEKPLQKTVYVFPVDGGFTVHYRPTPRQSYALVTEDNQPYIFQKKGEQFTMKDIHQIANMLAKDQKPMNILITIYMNANECNFLVPFETQYGTQTKRESQFSLSYDGTFMTGPSHANNIHIRGSVVIKEPKRILEA